MKIGFDVDNVLVDQFNYQMKYGVPYFEKRGISVKNKYGFDIEDIFVWVLNQKAGMNVARRGNFIDHNYVIIGKKK